MPMTLPLMPTNSSDWFKKIIDAPRENLIQPQQPPPDPQGRLL